MSKKSSNFAGEMWGFRIIGGFGIVRVIGGSGVVGGCGGIGVVGGFGGFFGGVVDLGTGLVLTNYN